MTNSGGGGSLVGGVLVGGPAGGGGGGSNESRGPHRVVRLAAASEIDQSENPVALERSKSTGSKFLPTFFFDT